MENSYQFSSISMIGWKYNIMQILVLSGSFILPMTIYAIMFIIITYIFDVNSSFYIFLVGAFLLVFSFLLIADFLTRLLDNYWRENWNIYFDNEKIIISSNKHIEKTYYLSEFDTTVTIHRTYKRRQPSGERYLVEAYSSMTLSFINELTEDSYNFSKEGTLRFFGKKDTNNNVLLKQFILDFYYKMVKTQFLRVTSIKLQYNVIYTLNCATLKT